MPSADLRGRLLSKQAASLFCDSSVSFIDRLIRAEKIRAIRITPKMTRIDGDSLADFLEAKANVPANPRGKARAAP